MDAADAQDELDRRLATFRGPDEHPPWLSIKGRHARERSVGNEWPLEDKTEHEFHEDRRGRTENHDRDDGSQGSKVHWIDDVHPDDLDHWRVNEVETAREDPRPIEPRTSSIRRSQKAGAMPASSGVGISPLAIVAASHQTDE
jgi:hypothetical protein